MARIVGLDIPRNKKVAYSLCYIHGIGLSTAYKICERAKIDTEKRVQDLTEKQIKGLELTKYLKNYSAIGEKYVSILNDIIEKNSLSDLDKANLLTTKLKKGIDL